jgi:phosphopantetheinyl transferase
MPVFKIIEQKNSKIGIWKLSETVSELENSVFDRLAENEKNEYSKFKSDSRKKEWLATRLLLHKLQNKNYFQVIKYAPTCKPFLDNEFIGISHSKNFVAIILSQKNNVSIDIEKISERAKKIVNKFLSTEEKKYFDIESQFDTSLLWSIKETVYKFYGQKQLPFIDGIKIKKFDTQKDKQAECVLMNKIILRVDFLTIEDNVLCFIAS